jgi:hypothetical protein
MQDQQLPGFRLPRLLSPLICMCASDEVTKSLISEDLLPLHDLFQHCVPLSHGFILMLASRNLSWMILLVSTRTSSSATVIQSEFHLRFTEFSRIVDSCKEDEDARATRFIEWLSSRIASQGPEWVESVYASDVASPPWWSDMRRCLEVDCVPVRREGWNYPIAGARLRNYLRL